MKRSLSLWVGIIVLIAAASNMASGQAQQQPLGDYARAVKRTKAPAAKTAAKVYDNDNLPPAASISVVGDNSKPADQDAKPASDQKDDAKPEEKKSDEKDPDEAKSEDKKPEDKEKKPKHEEL